MSEPTSTLPPDDELESWKSLDDHDLATTIAREAGRRLVDHRERAIERGIDYWALKASGDAVGQHFIDVVLRATRPDDHVLSEEAVDDKSRVGRDRVWIIDPLDGTNEYGEDRGDWAVHVALWEQGELTAAAVALPCFDRIFATRPAPTVPARSGSTLRLTMSRGGRSDAAWRVAETLGCEIGPLGSAGTKAMFVVMGEADIYVHDGGMKQWDSAAPVAVARAAGLHTSRVDGSPLVYNDRDLSLPDLVICRPELADVVLDCLSGTSGSR